MEKPKPEPIYALDYHKCIHFLEEKYNFDSRDYAGRYKERISNQNIPYQNFWHWVVEMSELLGNGSYITMFDNWAEDLPEDDFRTIILNYFFQEFGEYGEDEGSILRFWVEW